MTQKVFAAAAAGCALALAHPAAADHLGETDWERRTIVYLAVPDDVLRKFLPEGWRAVALETGPGRGANVTVNLSEQLVALDASGKASGDARAHGVTFSARVIGPASPNPEAMVLFGLTDGGDAPGPYGVHKAAEVSLERSASDLAGRTVHERWRAGDRDGDQLDVRLAYVPGPAVTGAVRQTTRSSVEPRFSREYRVETVTQPGASVAGEPLAVVASTGVPQALWPSTRRPVAVVSAPVYHREIWLRDAPPAPSQGLGQGQ
jgi:hypothetical protein